MKNAKILRGQAATGASIRFQANPLHRILVVDPDDDIRQLSAEVLTRSGYEAASAANGMAAWRALKTGRYDLLITDHKLPKVSGLELLTKLRASRLALPVIIASAKLPTEEFARHPWLHPSATLLKPFTVMEFLAAVRNALQMAGAGWSRKPTEPGQITRFSQPAVSRGALLEELSEGGNTPRSTPSYQARFSGS